MTKEDAVKRAHNMYAYEESEQADQENHDFDALWQSLYDVCQLATYGVLDLTDEDIQETKSWLKETQSMTAKYLETEIYF